MHLEDYPMVPLLGEDEGWVEVKDFPDYLISNYGRVYSCRRNIIMKPVLGAAGYLKVNFRIANVIYTHSIHRLVADAFVPGYDFGLEVNHIDSDKLNNHESNLEWVTHKDNLEHAYLSNRLPTWKKKVIIDNTGESFNSINECAEFLGAHPNNISRVLSGTRKSWKGYTFSYVE